MVCFSRRFEVLIAVNVKLCSSGQREAFHHAVGNGRFFQNVAVS